MSGIDWNEKLLAAAGRREIMAALESVGMVMDSAS